MNTRKQTGAAGGDVEAEKLWGLCGGRPQRREEWRKGNAAGGQEEGRKEASRKVRTREREEEEQGDSWNMLRRRYWGRMDGGVGVRGGEEVLLPPSESIST